MEVDINSIEKDPENPRLTDDEKNIENLIASFKAHHMFLTKPEIRAKPGDPRKYLCYQGWHRILAGKRMGLKTIDCHLQEKTIKGIHLDLATEDKVRKEYSFWERGELYSKIIKEQEFSENEYAKRYGLSQAMVSKCIKIHENIPREKAMVIPEEYTLDTWREIASLPQEARDKVLETIEGSDLKDQQVTTIIDNLKWLENMMESDNSKAQKKVLEDYQSKLWTYQVPDFRQVCKELNSTNPNPPLTKMKIQFEEGDSKESMEKFAIKYSGRYLGHFWIVEIDKVKYDQDQKTLESEELREKERLRKLKEVEKNANRNNDFKL